MAAAWKDTQQMAERGLCSTGNAEERSHSVQTVAIPTAGIKPGPPRPDERVR